jgi:hypothetical protein
MHQQGFGVWGFELLFGTVAEVDMSKFADEDQEEEEEPKSYHIKPQVRGLAWLQ